MDRKMIPLLKQMRLRGLALLRQPPLWILVVLLAGAPNAIVACKDGSRASTSVPAPEQPELTLTLGASDGVPGMEAYAILSPKQPRSLVAARSLASLASAVGLACASSEPRRPTETFTATVAGAQLALATTSPASPCVRDLFAATTFAWPDTPDGTTVQVGVRYLTDNGSAP